jgi:hypothetical protein
MGHTAGQVPPVNQTLTALDSSSWSYDAGGRLTTTCDFLAGGSCATSTGRHTDFTYDALGHPLTQKVYAAAGTGSLQLCWVNTYTLDGVPASTQSGRQRRHLRQRQHDHAGLSVHRPVAQATSSLDRRPGSLCEHGGRLQEVAHPTTP